MVVLVDTSVIIDVLTDDPVWADWSIGQLAAHEGSGLAINPVIYSELCYGFPTRTSPEVARNILCCRISSLAAMLRLRGCRC